MTIIRFTDDCQTAVAQASVYLAGSIDANTSKPWVDHIANAFQGQSVIFFDSSRELCKEDGGHRKNIPAFLHQVEWDIAHLEGCDIPFFNFEHDQSPRTMEYLNYAIVSRDNATVQRTMPIIVCPKDVNRNRGVKSLCDKYQIPLYSNLRDGIAALKQEITALLSD